MRNNKELRNDVVGVLICLMAAATLFTCTDVPDYCSRGNRYDPGKQFCFADKAYPLCSNGEYNPLTEGCNPKDNTVATRCADTTFVQPGTPCGGYALSTASAPANGGTITITRTSPEGQNYAANELVTLTAAAASGYEFTGWAGAETSVGATVTLSMDSNKPMVAMFSPRSAAGATTHTLATTAFPTNSGTITRDPSATSYATGTNVSVTAVAAAGYQFTGWSGASTSGSPTTTVTMDAGKTLVAMFTATSQTLTVNAVPSTGGTVFVNGTASTGVSHHNTGAQVRVLAQAADGYEFTGWSGASASAGTEVTISMNSNQMLTANFRQQQSSTDTTTPPPVQYTLTVNRTPTNGGTTSPESGLKHDAGTPVAITADAVSGYTFVNWTVTGGGTVANLNSTNTTVTLSSNATVTANFRVYTVTPGTYTLTINRDPSEGGAVFVNNDAVSGITSYEPETQITVRARPALGYKFTGWTGAVTSADTSLPITMRANVELTAKFENVGTHTLTINREPPNGGKIFINNVESAEVTTYTVGASLSVRAEAAPDYRFSGWTTGSSATANINAMITVVMNRDSVLTANFESLTVTRGTFTDTRDGQIYSTVKIGTQTWMAENLNFSGHFIGTSWCYNNADSNCVKYGRLYDWSTAMGLTSTCNSSSCGSQVQSPHKGMCPDGWHILSRAEWDTLVRFAGGNLAGTALKSSTSWNGTDEFGFSALPGGSRGSSSFSSVGTYGRWWSATEDNATYAYSRYMYTGNDYVSENSNSYDSYKTYGYSVRCLMDD